jgi:hypothetical protein
LFKARAVVATVLWARGGLAGLATPSGEALALG